MASENTGVGDHVLELIVRDEPESAPDGNAGDVISDEVAPLLTQVERPKINIFTLSYSRRKSRDQVTNVIETEISPASQFLLWIWGGSRYSGLLCMFLSSSIYVLMEVLLDLFAVQPIPLFETAFTRCTIIMILSYMWLRRSGHPIFGQSHVRNLLVSRAIVGVLSMSSFVYCIQRLPLSQAIVLNLTTPIMAAIVSRFILSEKLKITDIGGLACSYFGVLFIFQHSLVFKGKYAKAGETSNTYAGGSYHIYAVLVGLFSSITGGASYCLIRAGAKASDQPLSPVFSFGALASLSTGICTFMLEDNVIPGTRSSFLMLVLGCLAFLAEVLLARALQLEKTNKVANVWYFEVVLSQLWGISLLRASPSFGLLIGCLLIVVSVGYTMYIGPDKEDME